MADGPLSDPNEKTHFWLSNPPEGDLSETMLLDSDVNERYYIDIGDTVRVRVEYDEFHDDEPGPPKAVDGVYAKAKPRRPPYEITVSILRSL